MKKIILADQKLNQLVDDITAKLLQSAQDRFENGAIDGAGITEFCHHSQVNQFILFRIYQDWNAQISQMVHPYFDYSATEVKDGLRRFLNLLSSHILVKQADFEPLVRQAVYNSLKLILNAEDAIGRFFFLNTDAISIDVFRKHAPYFSSFDFVIQSILKYHEKNSLNLVERKVFFEKFDRVIELWEGKESRSISEYQRELFLNLTGKELEEVVGKYQEPEVAAVAEEPVAPVVAEQESEDRKKTVIRIRPENIQRPEEKREEPVTPIQRDAKPTTPPWVETKQPEVEERESKPSNIPPWVQEEVEVRSKPLVSTPKQEPKAEEKPRNLIEAFANREGKQPSLVERGQEKKESTQNPKIEVRVRTNEPPKEEMRKPEEEQHTPSQEPTVVPRSLLGSSERSDDFSNKEPRSLVDKFRQQASPVGADDDSSKSIKAEHIPVHKQFQYVQKVFGGSSVKFKVVLDKINKTETLEETNEVLDKYVFNDPNVNRNDKVSKEFEAMVRSRFQA
ncbi:MAG: hypothetical protein RLZZ519_398 [Bacteroidota bacterium]|jgi:hypothetical protein